HSYKDDLFPTTLGPRSGNAFVRDACLLEKRGKTPFLDRVYAGRAKPTQEYADR
ncbi:hypothetical protein NPIL_376141, partial [Nephila pilipes]